jgi:eukaryotic-like serine/threonine-protein kinase
MTVATLGRGGMATVELAHDDQLDRNVAIKRLSPALTGDEVFRERFVREARMAAALSHPNIVTVYDVGEEEGIPYIVMEYVEGDTLAELMKRKGPLDPDRTVDLVLQVCAGLEHAHASGLVHRDIKPQNLLVRPDDTVKIADFGIARPLDSNTELTQVGTVLGTAAYLAPEQALGEPVTGAADLYSLGAVTYEILSGKPPYEFESLVELTVKQREGPPPPIDGVALELQAVLLRCLAVEPEDRPRSAAALAHELAQASPEPPTQPLPAAEGTEATQVMSTPAGRSVYVSYRQLLVAVVLGLAALFGGLVFGLTRGGDDPAPSPAQPARQDVLPRGETPAESARLLADWLRERAG